MLIIEYAKLASTSVIQGQKTLDDRMKAIKKELQMTGEAVMKRATELAVATLK